MRNKILVVGNGVSAFALANVLSKTNEVYITSTSDVANESLKTIDIREDNSKELLNFVLENDIDLTIPFSENALKADIVTLFSSNKQLIFGPVKSASEITFNKVSAKKLLYKLRIPTPKFGIFDKESAAIDYIKKQQEPFVIKTNDSNSAAIMTSKTTAKNLISSGFSEKNYKLIVEDYIYGIPFSYYAVTDGYKALPLRSSVTYKHSLDGNGGQLTFGMGACSPNYRLSLDQEYFLMDNVIYPTLEYLEASGYPYIGVIGVNGITDCNGNISILGYQSFMQDCDSINIFNTIDEDLAELFKSCCIGSFSDEVDCINFKNRYAVSVTLCSTNKENKDNIISGIDTFSDDIILTLYPGIRKNKYMEFEAEYGPVFILTGFASTPSGASKKVYNEIKDINFKGMHYRKDICC